MREFVRAFLADETGATAIEYALMASFIASAIVVTVYSLGTTVFTNLYERIGDAMQ